MKIAIIGSRKFLDYELLKTTMDNYKQENNVEYSLIVSGGATGADTLGEQYADDNGIEKLILYAEWNKYGKNLAGHIRNGQIVKNSDFLFAFWDGKSTGTKNCMELAERKGIPIIVTLF